MDSTGVSGAAYGLFVAVWAIVGFWLGIIFERRRRRKKMLAAAAQAERGDSPTISLTRKQMEARRRANEPYGQGIPPVTSHTGWKPPKPPPSRPDNYRKCLGCDGRGDPGCAGCGGTGTYKGEYSRTIKKPVGDVRYGGRKALKPANPISKSAAPSTKRKRTSK